MEFDARLASRPILLAGLASFTLALGCQPPKITDEAGDETTTTTTTTATDTDTDTDPETTTPGDGDGDPDTTGPDPDPDGCVSALDVLFIVDNSGSMGRVQARLASSLPALLEPLEQAGVDWRIAVTTSDNGNPWCPAGATTPEGGKFVASSCRDRLGDFTFNNGEVDATNEACTDVCTLETLQFLPTTTEVDDSPAPRPWLESIGGQLNVEGSAYDVLPCIIPMGINGCGFESQLESAYLGLLRSVTEFEENYGFVRSTASLLVIFVSDEADCSYNKEWSEIFEPDGNKVFWSDPTSAFPTSAVCWNAGVECFGDPSGYDNCEATNYDVNGNSEASDADAVLHPIGRYLGLLQGLQLDKQTNAAGATVRAALIGGTLEGGGIVYAQAFDDPGFDNSFGIGPGCADGAGVEAVPPVRMRDVVEGSAGSLGSVCNIDYRPNLAAAVEPFISECN